MEETNPNIEYESLSDDEGDMHDEDKADESKDPTDPKDPTQGSSKPAKKRKKRRSKAWDTFDELPVGADNVLHVRCSKCGYTCVYNSSNGTGNMLKHQKVCLNTGDIRQMILSSSQGSITEFDALDRDMNLALDKTELDKYLEENRLNRSIEIDILEYWNSNQFRFPNLALMARDILSIPISTVASESAFSTGGRILDQYRSCLAHAVVESLICTRDWRFNEKEVLPNYSLEELTQDIIKLSIADD